MTFKKEGIASIQIIGTQRSGSNLLRLILNQSPKISAHHPPHILSVFKPIIHKYGNLNKSQNFYKLVNDVCRLVEVNPVKWDLILNRDEIISLCDEPSLIEVFKAIYLKMAINDNADFWCCKSMANVNYYKEIENSGIKPYYIHLIRDGRDVAASFKNTLVGEKHPYHIANIWKSDFLKGKEIFQDVGVTRYIPIYYETLISNPKNVLDRLNNFLNLNLNGNALNYFDSHESKLTAAAGYMWSNLTQPIIKNNKEKFFNSLSKEEIEIFENVAGNTLYEAGYKLFTKPIKKAYTPKDIMQFNSVNNELKSKALKSEHLRLDREYRINRKQLLEELSII